MSARRFETLPAALQQLHTRPLFVMHLDVKPMVILGDTLGTFRRVGIVTSGTFTGERLSGTVLDGGSDRQTVRSDGSITLDVNLTLQTDDGIPILMSYRGLRFGEVEVMKRLDRGESVDPSEYYFRTNPTFEAPTGKYDWLNRTLAIATGHRFPDGPVYSVFEVL